MAKNRSIEQALAELQRAAPDAPFLALGQTVFWDEPMKGGLLLASKRLGYDRKLIAGVHDTDYFAKLPAGRRHPGKFKAFPHNDTTTKGLWSAAAEFSALLGSETVVSKDILQGAGLKIGKVLKERPEILDEATEAWGWRGIVSLDESPPVTAEVPLKGLFPELFGTLEWALESSLEAISGSDHEAARDMAEKLKEIVCTASDEPGVRHLGEFYRALIQPLYDFAAARSVELETTATTELLRFNRQTAPQPRFRILDAFLRHSEESCAAYDDAIKGSEIYGLSRFGTGAIPFDLVVPGKGRGTIRVAPRAIVVMTPTPQFISLKKPVTSAVELAEAIEAKLGPNCVLVGKAVTLIGMLAAEFVFVFHEGASSYVKFSRKLHDRLAPVAPDLKLNPILRVKYEPWDEMDTCCAWLSLPEPFRQAFGAEDICAPNLAVRWRQVVEEQTELLKALGQLRRPIELIRFLAERVGGSWNSLATEYERLHEDLMGLKDAVQELRDARAQLKARVLQLRRERVEAERRKGEQFRQRIFEQNPTEDALAERQKLTAELQAILDEDRDTKLEIRKLMRKQDELVKNPEVMKVHERRRIIEVEAELKRLSLVRSAVIAGQGLQRAASRPSAWWFPLLCPDGLWFRSTVENAECYLEPLQA